MAQQILIKRSAVPAKVPSVADLQLGELAINTSDGKLFIKKDDGAASIVQIGADVTSSDVTSALGYTPAALDGTGKILSAQLPALAITDTYVVASQAAMLALTTAEIGDVAIRTDLNKSFILKGASYATLSDWQELLSPTDAVQSVNGQQGTVTLTTSNITEGTNQYFTEARSRSSISATGSLSYNSATGVISYTAPTSGSGAGDFKADGSVVMTGSLKTYAGTLAAPAIRIGTIDNTGIFSNGGVGSIAFSVSGVNKMELISSQLIVAPSIYAQTNVVTQRGTNATPTFSFAADTNTGMYCQTEDQLSFATGGVERMMLSNNNVAVNVTLNSQAISATGAISSTSAITGKSIVVNDAAGTFRTLWWKSGTGNRWNLHADNAAESGSNAGSNFSMMAIMDNEAQANVYSVVRSTQVLTFAKSPIAPTPATSDNSTQLATTAFVKAQSYITSAGAPVQSVAGRTGAVVLAVTDVAGSAPLASPALTGLPTAPTQASSDNSTKLATTAFVKAQSYITSAGAPVQSVSGRTGAVVLTAVDVGLNLVDNKSSVTIRNEITSSNVTTALGYTPYNATTNLQFFQGKGADIGASVDFDTLTAHGVYYQNSDAQAATCLNAPIGISGKLTVTSGDTSIGYWQEYETYKHNNNRTRTFKRQRYSSAWSAWTEVAAVDLVPAINPVTPKDGDIKVEAGPIISIYAATAWRQIFPAVYA